MKKLKVISLFSGIGSFEKALTNLNLTHTIENYCEIDSYASQAYSVLHDLPITKNLGDITKIDLESLPLGIDLLTHGSPCQSFSIIGKGEGGDVDSDTKSSLMWTSVKIIQHIKPTVVIWENVRNVLSPKHRHNFEAYINKLSELGYDSTYQVLNAKDFDLPQHRERIFVVSILNAGKPFVMPKPKPLTKPLSDYIQPKVDTKYYLKPHQYPHLLNCTPVRDMSKVTDLSSLYKIHSFYNKATNVGYVNTITPHCSRCDRSAINVIEYPRAENYKTYSDYVRRLTPLEVLTLMGFSKEDYTKLRDIPLSDGQIYKQAGNAIAVTVLEAIFSELIMQYPTIFHTHKEATNE